MSNRNRQATGGSTLADKKLKRVQEQVSGLQEQLRAAQFQVLNMRQMYEGAVQEKLGLQNQLQRTTTMLIGAVVQSRGKTLTLKEATLGKLNGYAGIDTQASDGNLVLRAISVEELQAMQEDIDEVADEDA
jgi:hypothetical protein